MWTCLYLCFMALQLPRSHDVRTAGMKRSGPVVEWLICELSSTCWLTVILDDEKVMSIMNCQVKVTGAVRLNHGTVHVWTHTSLCVLHSPLISSWSWILTLKLKAGVSKTRAEDVFFILLASLLHWRVCEDQIQGIPSWSRAGESLELHHIPKHIPELLWRPSDSFTTHHKPIHHSNRMILSWLTERQIVSDVCDFFSSTEHNW